MRFTIHSKTASTAFKMIIAFTGEEKCDLFPASSSFSAPRLFPETHAFLQAEGQTCPLACCLPHAGGWKCGQGQATQWVVACRKASGPLDGAASRWHPRPEQSGGRKYARQLTGGTPMPRCQGGCCLANAGLKRSTNTSLVSGR